MRYKVVVLYLLSLNTHWSSVDLRGYTAILKNYIDGSWKTFVMGREVSLVEFKKPKEVDNYLQPSYEQRLYHELYKEVHLLFDKVNKARISGKDLKF